MSCLLMGNKKVPSDIENNGVNKYAGTTGPSKLLIGIDGSLDVNLTCQYCKDTGPNQIIVSGYNKH